MQSLLLCTNRTVTTFRGKLCFLSQGKCLQEYSWTDWYPPLEKKFSQRASANRSTTDMVFVLRQLQEKCREQNKGLNRTRWRLVTLLKLSILWVENHGVTRMSLKFSQYDHPATEDQCGQVRHSNDLSEPFPIDNSIKQSCILAPTLFTIYFSIMLQWATVDLDDKYGVYNWYCTDGSLFDLRWLKAHTTKTVEKLIREMLSCCPYRDSPAVHNVLLCRGCSPLWIRRQLEKKKTEARTSGSLPSSSRHHWWDRVENSLALQLHFHGCQGRQRDWQ